MTASEAAYWNLVSLAKTDGAITAGERMALDRYRVALNLSTAAAQGIEGELGRVPGGTFRVAGSPQDRIYILRMMAVVAYSDGGLSPRERQRLERVAVALGVGPAQFADLLVSAEREAQGRGRDRGALYAILFGVVAFALLILLVTHKDHPATGPAADLSKEHEELAALRAMVDKMTRERAEEDARRVRETQEAMKKAEAELEKRLSDLEKRASQPSASPDLAGEVAALKADLAKRRERGQAFKSIQKRYDASVLLIFIQYDMVRGTERETLQGCGTGFFVTPSGHIATNKHVLQPWKFIPDTVKYVADGWTPDPKSMLIAAWRAGSDARTEDGLLDLTTAFNTQHKSLMIVGLPPDEMEEREETLNDGTKLVAQFHKQSDADLAILKAKVDGPIRAVPLAKDASAIEKLDPVMVLGFPTGTSVLESRCAETSPSLGEVRKIEDTVLVTAAIVPGNSGGPLFDLDGEAVGVSTRIFGESTVGACIQSKHVIDLLPTAAVLAREAKEYEKKGIPWAALDEARLAELRGPTDAQRKEIEELRARLLADRDARMATAKGIADKDGARKAYEAILASFGEIWGKDAVEALARLR